MLIDAFTFDKLLASHKKCRCCKQHKNQTINFEINLAQNLATMSSQLLSKTYQVGPYKAFKIYEPKERLIEALGYKDRVVLMALCTNVIQPKLERCLIYDNVACRKGKGTHFGVRRLESFLHSFYNKNGSNKGYFLKCDITKFFQSINHDILISLLKKTTLDEEDMWIIERIIASKNAEAGVGLPIGNQTSQWFGLFYLNVVDRLIKEKLRVKYYVRYMDDMILVHEDKEFLQFCKQQIEKCAKEKLNLSLNRKTQIGRLEDGIDFLGFRHILLESGKVLRLLRQQAKYRLKNKIKFIAKCRDLNLVNDQFIKVRLNAFNAHLCHSNAKKLYFKYKKKFDL